jgi:hypothetical protein
MIHRGTPSRSSISNGSTDTIAAADVRSGSKNTRNNNNNATLITKGGAPMPPSLVSGAYKGGSAKTAINTATATPAVTKPIAALECLNSLQFFCVKVCVTSTCCLVIIVH